MIPDDPRALPLEDLHQAAEARFGGFAGWRMPLTYPLGVLREHLWTREHAGLFDISHMRLFAVEGEGAAALLDRACPIEAAALAAGQSKLTFFLDERAGILDDLIVTRLDARRFMVVANAGNAAADEAHLRGIAADFAATVETLPRVILALQGPEAEAALRAAGVEACLARFMTGAEPAPGWFVTRSGYTGEDGFELALPEADARDLAGRLLADERVRWIGLAARDSLRLEAGLCLHGQDISPDTDPVSASLLWAVPKGIRAGGRFVGAEALEAIIERGAPTRRVGIAPASKQPVRGGATLLDEAGATVGCVTSGGFGPSVNAPVAMGYVRADRTQPGETLFAQVRGNRIPVAVHLLPFVPHRSLKG